MRSAFHVPSQWIFCRWQNEKRKNKKSVDKHQKENQIKLVKESKMEKCISIQFFWSVRSVCSARGAVLFHAPQTSSMLFLHTNDWLDFRTFLNVYLYLSNASSAGKKREQKMRPNNRQFGNTGKIFPFRKKINIGHLCRIQQSGFCSKHTKWIEIVGGNEWDGIRRG